MTYEWVEYSAKIVMTEKHAIEHRDEVSNYERAAEYYKHRKQVELKKYIFSDYEPELPPHFDSSIALEL